MNIVLSIVTSMNNVSNESDLISKIIVAIIGAIAGVILTHFFYKSKLHKEQKVRFEDVIGNRIAESLLNIRDIVKISETVEIYNIVGELRDRGSKLDFLDGGARYPAFFNDWKSYNLFMDEISKARKLYEKNVDCETALYLLYINRYLYQLSAFMSEFGNEKLLPVFGAIFLPDILDWRKKFDKVLVKKINSHKCKLETHSGRKYKAKRKKIVEERWKKSLLQIAITGKAVDKKGEKALPLIQLFIYEIRNSPHDFIQAEIVDIDCDKNIAKQ